ncbi:MAG TPA: hypothetical protein VES42_23350 [Pilimelia sp.]|nr:hypothetical protein [Pilimelia sp.]
MATAAAYDAHADWYDSFVSDSWTHMDRVRGLLGDLLGPGRGLCLDLCCGGGAHAAAIADRGWTPIGADWSQPSRVVIDTRYAERDRAFAGPPAGVRVRVGAWHVPLADLLTAFLDAGLRIDATAESTANGIADLFAVRAVKSG